MDPAGTLAPAASAVSKMQARLTFMPLKQQNQSLLLH